MTSQRQWVLMYARRKELVVVPARYFKWDSARDWGLKFGAHFSAKLGMNFEEESAPALKVVPDQLFKKLDLFRKMDISPNP